MVNKKLIICGAERSQPVRRTEAAPDHRPRPCGQAGNSDP